MQSSLSLAVTQKTVLLLNVLSYMTLNSFCACFYAEVRSVAGIYNVVNYSRAQYNCNPVSELQIWGSALLSNTGLCKREQCTVCALKENCLNSIKVATHSDISWELKGKLWPSVWNSDHRAKRGKPGCGPRWTWSSWITAVSVAFSPHSLAL